MKNFKLELANMIEAASKNEFVQKIILSGVCQQLYWLTTTSSERVTETEMSLKDPKLSDVEEEKLIDKLNFLMDQEDEVKNLLTLAKELHKAAFKAEWEPAKKKEPTARVSKEELLARLAARKAGDTKPAEQADTAANK